MQKKSKIVKKTLSNSSFVQDFISLFPKRQPTIGLAVSGGIDSMVMLEIFRRFSKSKKYQIVALHFNHKWRKEATKDAKLVQGYCRDNGIPLICGEAKGKIVKSEDNARLQRYTFLKKMGKKYKLDFVCTAHHMDDQLETVLYRLIRGTGPQGLLPIKRFYKSDNLIIGRPFLTLSRSEIEGYASKHKVRHVFDKSNKDVKYKRNFLRLNVIPKLTRINSNAQENILSSMFLAYCHNVVASKRYKNILNKIAHRSKYVWSRSKFLKLAIEEKCFVLYSYLNDNAMKGSVSKIFALLDLIFLKKSVDLDKKYRLQFSGDKILFVNKVRNKQKKRRKLKINLKLKLSKKEKVEVDKGALISLEPYKKRGTVKKFPNDRSKIAYVNLASLSGKTVTIRNRNQADIFKPLGFPVTLKLKKYLINKKIPVEKRGELPLLCKGKEVLWIPGYSISDKIKVTTKPTTILKLR